MGSRGPRGSTRRPGRQRLTPDSWAREREPGRSRRDSMRGDPGGSVAQRAANGDVGPRRGAVLPPVSPLSPQEKSLTLRSMRRVRSTRGASVCLLAFHPLVLSEFERLLADLPFSVHARRLEPDLIADPAKLVVPKASVFVLEEPRPSSHDGGPGRGRPGPPPDRSRDRGGRELRPGRRPLPFSGLAPRD